MSCFWLLLVCRFSWRQFVGFLSLLDRLLSLEVLVFVRQATGFGLASLKAGLCDLWFVGLSRLVFLGRPWICSFAFEGRLGNLQCFCFYKFVV